VVITGHAEGGDWHQNLERDLGLSPRELQKIFFHTPAFASLMTGQSDLYADLQQVWPKLKCEASVEAFVDYWFSCHSAMDSEVLSLVAELRSGDTQSFLATNQEHHRARYVWKTLGLSEHFDGMIYSAALGAQKPDPAFFTKALGKLPAKEPREILFLDDSLPNVEAAVAAGWNAVHFREANDLRRAMRP
jgi:putative hydrolase of the HAD superfamily